MLRFLNLLTLALAILSGCSKSGDNRTAPHGISEPKPPVVGPRVYSLEVKKLENRFYWGACDDQIHPLRKEIASAIDEKMPWLKEIYRARARANVVPATSVLGENEIMLASFTFQKATPLQADKWVTSITSWKEVEFYYKKAQESGTPSDWGRVVSAFQYVFDKDSDRLLRERNMSIGPNHYDPIASLHRAIRHCSIHNLDGCLDPQDQKTLKENFNFNRMWEDLVSDDDESMRYQKLRFLISQIEAAWENQFGFRRNRFVRRDGNNFIVPIRTADFASIKPQLKEIIESYWTYGNQRVIVEWSDSPSVFEFLIPPYRMTATTYFNTRKVYIYHGDTIEAFPHEFGHVIGLPDDYFVMWNWQNCSYETVAQASNIMSEAEGGHALKKHFDRLNEAYP